MAVALLRHVLANANVTGEAPAAALEQAARQFADDAMAGGW
jgi:hypothetical protein